MIGAGASRLDLEHQIEKLMKHVTTSTHVVMRNPPRLEVHGLRVDIQGVPATCLLTIIKLRHSRGSVGAVHRGYIYIGFVLRSKTVITKIVPFLRSDHLAATRLRPIL